MRYVRIYDGQDGETHFEDVAVELASAAFAPPAPPFDLAVALPVADCVFFEIAPGWVGDWHPAPRRQLCFVLAGELDVEVSDGERRIFRPGDVALLEDIAGRGHVTRAVGSARAAGAFVKLAP